MCETLLEENNQKLFLMPNNTNYRISQNRKSTQVIEVDCMIHNIDEYTLQYFLFSERY